MARSQHFTQPFSLAGSMEALIHMHCPKLEAVGEHDDWLSAAMGSAWCWPLL